MAAWQWFEVTRSRIRTKARETDLSLQTMRAARLPARVPFDDFPTTSLAFHWPFCQKVLNAAVPLHGMWVCACLHMMTDCACCLVESNRHVAAALFSGHVSVCTCLDMATVE